MNRVNLTEGSGNGEGYLTRPAWLTCLIALILIPNMAWAGSKEDASAAANRAVRDVLQAETQTSADRTNRSEALQPTLEATPDHPAARWQAGQVRSGKEWLAFENAVVNEAADPRLADYRQRRDAAEKTFDSQLELSNWCRKQKLTEQERSHLVQSLLLATPNQDVSRIYERLGYRRIGSEWMSRQDLADLERQAKEIQASLDRWSPRLKPLASKLDGTIPQIRQAKEQLDEITDARAIPAIEAKLSTRSQFAATTAVRKLSQMHDYRSSRALARQAVMSPWESVRHLAADTLKERRFEDFLPDLMSLMYTPIESRMQILQGFRGGFLLDGIVRREGQDETRQHHFTASAFGSVIDVNVLIPGRDGGKLARSLRYPHQQIATELVNTESKRVAADLVYSRQRQIDVKNELTTTLNKQLGDALRRIVGTSNDDSADPHYWWDWWAQYTGIELPGKRVVLVEEGNQVVPLIPVVQVVPFGRSSCLVAGTPVLTDHGLAPIEQIRVGDLVLAKDIETGELAYKPVLHTTVRRPSPTFVFTVGDDSITASVGHNWWVSGAGWTKTRELRDGQPIHTATGMSRVSQIETAAEEKTYNLVVADFHTYFVGHSHILSHDVLPPRPTNRLVPGLVDE